MQGVALEKAPHEFGSVRPGRIAELSGIPAVPAVPAPLDEQGKEILALAGGLDTLLARATQLSEAGNHRMACHLIDWAWHADNTADEVRQVRSQVYKARTKAEASTMAKGVFGAVAREMSD